MRELEKGLVKEQYMDFVFFKRRTYILSLLLQNLRAGWLRLLFFLRVLFPFMHGIAQAA